MTPAETAQAAQKIEEITAKVTAFKDKIFEIRDRYVTKINEQIEKLENIINEGIAKINAGMASAQAWLEVRMKAITKKIQGYLDALKAKIDSLIAQFKEWYNTTINNIKIRIVIGAFAKLEVYMDAESAQPLADAIPHPDITSMIPEIELQLQLPELGQIGVEKISIPRLEI